MRPDESFIGNPVRSLQSMLRAIAKANDKPTTLIPDGIYGQETARSVTEFQHRHGIPATGVADQATWDQIVDDYASARIEVSNAEPVNVVLNCNQVIEQGEYNPSVLLAQAILMLLADTYGCFPAPNVSGTLDAATVDALESVQMLCDLPVTGKLDKKTWKNLALHYPGISNHKMRKMN